MKITKALSLKDIEKITLKIRHIFGYKDDESFNILKCLETLHYKNILTLQYLEDDDPIFQDNSCGKYDPIEKAIYIKESALSELENHKYRTNFTLAHEFFHFIQCKLLKFQFKNSKNENKFYKMVEWQANEFAGQLLVPNNMLILYSNDKYLAQKLKVSEQCILTRRLYFLRRMNKRNFINSTNLIQNTEIVNSSKQTEQQKMNLFSNKHIPFNIVNTKVVFIDLNDHRLTIRIIVDKEHDYLNNITDETKLSVVQFIFENIKIKNLNYDSFCCFRGSEIFNFKINNETNYMNFSFGFNSNEKCSKTSFDFAFSSLTWSFICQISKEEFEQFIKYCNQAQRSIEKSKDTLIPHWATLSKPNNFQLRKRDKFYMLNKMIQNRKIFSEFQNLNSLILIDFKICDGNLQGKLLIDRYRDKYGIIKDDNHYLLYEFIYKNISVYNISLFGPINFKGAEIKIISNNVNEQNKSQIYFIDIPQIFDSAIVMDFNYETCLWKAVKILSSKQVDDFCLTAKKIQSYYLDSYNSFDVIWAENDNL